MSETLRKRAKDAGSEAFPNTDGRCFFSSLAKLLAFHFDDTETANLVYEGGVYHPLVIGEGGVLSVTAPRMVSDCTVGRYQGTLYYPDGRLTCAHAVAQREYSPLLFRTYEEIVEQEIASGRIVLFEGTFSVKTPHLALLHDLPDDLGHVVVSVNRDVNIDNNGLCEFDTKQYRSFAALVVERNDFYG
jgi:hypothetical protein